MYTFKEGDFLRIHLNDIEDMLLLHVQNKLFNLEGDAIVDIAVALRMFTQRIVIQKRVEDVQLGVKSYQKKLNISRPQKDCSRISVKEPYNPSYDPKGVIYEDKQKRKRLMRIDELYKFCDGTLSQNQKDLSTDIPIVRLEVLRYDKRSKVRMGIISTKTELALEQTHQGVSDEVLVSIEGVEE
ncbi:hypothetical protein Tco_0894408 [Tanacetum coccineum]|uniref:Uncharacterized protein n=1 Tax=Tanacetum coccineum TaxID=301880 RepID=A0ABQ5CBM2_9ASTR